MKQGWELKKLGEVCDLINGSTPLKSNKDYWVNGSFPWFTIEDLRIQGRVINYTNQFITEIGLKKLKILPVDTVLLCCTASIGEYAITKIELTTNQQFNGLVIKDKNKLSPSFLLYFSSTLREKLYNLSGKATIDFISISKLKNIEIPIPPLPEQEGIVSILDKAFSAIEQAKINAEKNLKNAKELFDSYLNGVFTNKGEDWEDKKLGEVCELKSGTTISPLLENNTGDIIYTKIADMNLLTNEIEINTSSRFVNSKEIKLNQIIPNGAVIFPKRGGAIATNKKRKIIKPTIVDLNTMAIIPSKQINNDYFFHWFQLFDLNTISNGSNIPQINNYSFDEVYISYPMSLTEQQAIVEKLDALSAETKQLEVIYQQKLTELENFKKSILRKAFNGELIYNI